MVDLFVGLVIPAGTFISIERKQNKREKGKKTRSKMMKFWWNVYANATFHVHWGGRGVGVYPFYYIWKIINVENTSENMQHRLHLTPFSHSYAKFEFNIL